MNNLHCGACMQDFNTNEELNLHLDTCVPAKILLPYITLVGFGGDAIGHPISHFIHLTHKHAYIIKRYAYAVADDMDSFSRSAIHSMLCEDMDIDYNKFRPFESSEITELPSRQEAEEILWYALIKYFKLNTLLEESNKIRKKNERSK